MRFLFWNTNKNGDINDILCKIVIEQKINIVILAEYADVVEDLILNLDLHGVRMKVYPTVGCDRITMLGTEISIRQSRQDTYYSMQIINEQYLLCGLHLPSSLWADKETQSLVFESIVHDVELAEEENGLGKSIVVGDFNQNPYENGCLSAKGFHGVPVADEALRLARTIYGKSYKMFYNPMWNLLGDFDFPSGTYYYSGSKAANEFWNMFDQVIIRPQLREEFVDKELKIITQTENISLVDEKRKPNKNISDHLPIVFQLKEDWQ